jgi:hypothetical protein
VQNVHRMEGRDKNKAALVISTARRRWPGCPIHGKILLKAAARPALSRADVPGRAGHRRACPYRPLACAPQSHQPPGSNARARRAGLGQNHAKHPNRLILAFLFASAVVSSAGDPVIVRLSAVPHCAIRLFPLALMRLYAHREAGRIGLKRPEQIPTKIASPEEIMRTKAFRHGVNDVRRGKPPRFDTFDDDWEYERGRQFAVLAPHCLEIVLGERLNPKAVQFFKSHQKDIC